MRLNATWVALIMHSLILSFQAYRKLCSLRGKVSMHLKFGRQGSFSLYFKKLKMTALMWNLHLKVCNCHTRMGHLFSCARKPLWKMGTSKSLFTAIWRKVDSSEVRIAWEGNNGLSIYWRHDISNLLLNGLLWSWDHFSWHGGLSLHRVQYKECDSFFFALQQLYIIKCVLLLECVNDAVISMPDWYLTVPAGDNCSWNWELLHWVI